MNMATPNKQFAAVGKFPHKTHRQADHPKRPIRSRREKRAELFEQRKQTFSRALEAQSLLFENTSVNSGVQAVIAWLHNEFNCEQVSIATWAEDKVDIRALSCAFQIEHPSEIHELHFRVHRESNLKRSRARFVAYDQIPANGQRLQSHRRLAEFTKMDVVLSQPLTTSSGQQIGSVVVLGSYEDMANGEVESLLAAVGPRLLSDLIQQTAKSDIGHQD